MRRIRIVLIFAACLCFVSSTVTAQKAKTVLTNTDVIEMVKAGLPESTILLTIQQSEPNFETSPKALIELAKQRVNQNILDAMLQVQAKSTDKPESTRQPVFETPTYRITVESLERKANNYIATLIFENLTEKTISFGWLEKSSGLWRDDGPYLIDERANKYFAEGIDSANVIRSGIAFRDNAQVLPKTKLKSRFLFFGNGEGKTFTLKASRLKDMGTEVVSINGLKVTLNEDKASSNEILALPTLNTAFYRVVIESAKRVNNDVVLTLVFESLVDKPFRLKWGLGSEDDFNSESFETMGPYLIDENADRYYVRKQDRNSEFPQILPQTKFRTQFVFPVAGKGTVFTFACIEISPKEDQPIVIKGITVPPKSFSTPSSSGEPIAIEVSSNPESIVTDAFSTFRQGNSGGVSKLMSPEGMSNSVTYCQGLTMNCLRSNYSNIGEFKSTKTRVLTRSDSAAKIVLQTIWLLSGYENRRCQTYQLDMTDAGWRITSFDIPRSCSE